MYRIHALKDLFASLEPHQRGRAGEDKKEDLYAEAGAIPAYMCLEVVALSEVVGEGEKK